MAQAARAYRRNAYPDYASERRFSAADVRAVRTSARPAQAAQPSLLPTIGRLAAIVIVFAAVLCFARIALTNAAVTTLMESNSLSVQIEEARTAGVGLEMQQSVLASPTAVNSAVKRLGMVAPGEVETIVLAPDVVCATDQGTLSLSGSAKKLAAAQAPLLDAEDAAFLQIDVGALE